MDDEKETEQLRAELAQAHTEAARLGTALADACATRDALAKERDGLEKSRQFFIKIAEGRDRNLVQAREELAQAHATETSTCADLTIAQARLSKDRDYSTGLEQHIEHLTSNRDFWFETCLATEAERDQIRKEAQGQRNLAVAEEAAIVEAAEAVLAQEVRKHEAAQRQVKPQRRKYLVLNEDYQNLQNALEHRSEAAAKLLERLATLSTAEAALADCGIGGIYDTFDGPADATAQMAEHIKELDKRGESGENAKQECDELREKLAACRLSVHVLELREGLERQAVHAERELRREAERCHKAALVLAQSRGGLLSHAKLQVHLTGQRAEALQQEKVGVHEALDECQILRNYDDAKPASARTRIFWLNQRAERAEALAALANEEMAALLKRLSDCTLPNTFGDPYALRRCVRDRKAARALAARIREVLEANDES